ncbi:Phosphatidic acid phosphatase type 2/haloperoxidase [Pseudocohnilembus persalinus]|uniref:Phosphatidic acid phosphatase type 2/haloperoxidase n=1 Tax=Pseudocohnilembus persalinus TaxID=266149 RepID=A0A0V0QV53_PSEPJ|nr:Phosphatidic acid phosphatase type 2/haloperoxidase [Pseudocohnilembus persalinus]|eukprot:KRX06291.1 Phosphatidic acid phosphatase type 2/haloperoxidase [Pseudocohnilembus persalinus]
MIEQTQTLQCLKCSQFLLQIYACPKNPIFDQNTLAENIYELLMVSSSVIFGYPFGAICVLMIIYYRSIRRWLIGFVCLFQQVAFEYLKVVFQQQRPAMACKAKVSNYGMPSGHCTFIFALLTWYVLELILLDKNCTFRQIFEKQYKKTNVY